MTKDHLIRSLALHPVQLTLVILACMLVNGFVAAVPRTPMNISDIFIDECERYLRDPPEPIKINEYVTFEATYIGIIVFIISVVVVVTKEAKRKSISDAV